MKGNPALIISLLNFKFSKLKRDRRTKKVLAFRKVRAGLSMKLCGALLKVGRKSTERDAR